MEAFGVNVEGLGRQLYFNCGRSDNRFAKKKEMPTLTLCQYDAHADITEAVDVHVINMQVHM